ncbi:leukocyte receptor cluster member 1 [Kryptolebias marmoratus]|uniref:Leukocyte receptor cluster member 1 n=1 Tax=Kryptolebias marmoratus TaxID=37003 RepID=A0A3Q3EYG8_KRYMA|nr:leukocyte receptor cluster member 1 [Kryptolebias marmoratus]XP_017271021.1 leukocyte receptor cluster member 1 [Kryptolebias marmoratus]XP_017271022.1 leukocyte receptor cluster member 1 [Kryptolebias marmoratus]XP_024861564.1 leukocyte receptor cluster member 1 [Kryptolebias marmoratus]XP_037836039.1 leukocyte receptor cluster member 1 [Kryptolebias marmoratus]
MNILPKKSWHVRNKDNVARVRKDEAQAAEEEREAKRRVERAEQEARTEYLRRKARASLQPAEGRRDDNDDDQSKGSLEHLNLFPLEESSEKKGNEEYLKEKKEEQEKQERAIGLLVSLGPQPGSEVTPWYLKSREEKEERREKDNKKGISEEEREKKDRRLKGSLDPMNDMKKALGVYERREHKKKKQEKRDRGEKRSSGESSGPSSMERLRAERLQREAEERRRARALVEQRSGKGKEAEREVGDRDRPYNNAYFPELARKRQRRDRESWRDEILKS